MRPMQPCVPPRFSALGERQEAASAKSADSYQQSVDAEKILTFLSTVIKISDSPTKGFFTPLGHAEARGRGPAFGLDWSKNRR